MAPDLDLVLFAMHCRRLYRKKIKCTACNKVIYSKYKADQLTKTQNNNLSVKLISVDFLQKKLCFATATIISSSASIAADNSTYLTSASLAVTGSISCELDKCEESVPPNKNVFELTTTTEVQERLDETVIQLKDQDNDLHEVMNGDAGDKEEDFAANSEIFTVSANSEMVKNVFNESEDKDYKIYVQAKFKKTNSAFYCFSSC